MSQDMQTVTFQAAKTNSLPPPLPYNIEQGLRGEVGTTRLPAGLSKNSSFLGGLITGYNFGGVLWILWPTPIVAAILATCVATISASLAGLFHGIPYLEQRREGWTTINWRLLHLCFSVSLVTSAAITWALISHPPTFAFASVIPKKENRIKSELAIAERDCAAYGNPYHGIDCRWKADLLVQLDRQTKTIEVPVFIPSEPLTRQILIYAFSLAVLAGVHGIAAYGAPFSSETGNAIWREPHGGYGNQHGRKPPETTDDKTKRSGLDNWLAFGGVTRHETPEPSAKLSDVYAKYTKWLGEQTSPPPSYDIGGFQRAMKDATGKDAIKTAAGVVFPGISFTNTTLI